MGSLQQMQRTRRSRAVPILALVALAVLLSCGSANAQAWVEGKITDASTGSPVGGVFIKNTQSTLLFTFSDQNGYYKCPATLGGNVQIILWHPDYLPAPRFKIGPALQSGEHKIKDWSLSPISITGQVFDTFTRANTNNPLDMGLNDAGGNDWGNPTDCHSPLNPLVQSVGTTEDAGQYEWGIGWIRTKANIKNNALELPVISQYDPDGPSRPKPMSPTNNFDASQVPCGSYGFGNPWTSDGVSLGDPPVNFIYPDDFPFMPNDFEFTTVIKNITWEDRTGYTDPVAIIAWHQMPVFTGTNILEPKAQYDFGPHLKIYAKPRGSQSQIDLRLSWQGGTEAQWSFYTTTVVDWTQPHTIRIKVQGYNVMAWLDNGTTPLVRQKYLAYPNLIVPVIVQDDKTWANADPIHTRRPGYIGYYRGQLAGVTIDSMHVDVFGEGSGDLGGRVTDADTGAGIKDARVYLTPTRYEVTRDDANPAPPDEDGYYEFFMVQPGHYDMVFMADGYESKTVPYDVIGEQDEEVRVALEPLVGTAFVVTDDFNRTEQPNLGTTTDPLQLPWDKSLGASCGIMNEKLRLDSADEAGVSVGGGFLPADFDASVTVNIGASENGWVGIAYRQSMPGSCGNWNGQLSEDAGYVVKLNALNSGDPDPSTWNPERFYVTLFRNFDPATGDPVPVATHFRVVYDNDQVPSPAPFVWDPSVVVRVKAVGNHHQVWVGGEKVIDVFDDAKLTGGYFSLVRDDCGVYFDDLSIAALGVSGVDAGEIKDAPDGTMVQIQGPDVVVSGAYSGFFYMEDTDRTAGIKIVNPTAVGVGNHAWIIGTMKTADGEKYIDAWKVEKDAATEVIRPLGMKNQSNAPALGLSNLGLLTKVWGKVLSLGPAGAYCFVDDANDGVGIKVYIPGTTKPTVGKTVSCIGVSSMDPGGVPVIRMRSNADLKQYN